MSDTIEMLTRRDPAAKVTTGADRTFRVLASTFADVQRPGYIERLSSDPKDWNFSREHTPAGIPLILDHNAFEVSANVGRAYGFEVTPRGVICDAKIGSSPEADRVIQARADDFTQAVSIGYSVGRYEVFEENGVTVRLAKEITVLEVSIVNIGADQGAYTRSVPMPKEEIEAIDRREIKTPPLDPVLSIADRRDIGIRMFGEEDAAEYRAEIDEVARKTRGKSKAEVRKAMFDLKVDLQDSNPNATHPYGEVRTFDDPTFRIRAMGEALHHRINPAGELSEPARQFAGLSVAEIARKCLEARGERTMGMSPATLITRAGLHTTSDFVLILADVARRQMRPAYDAAKPAMEPMARRTTAVDFRAKQLISLSAAETLKKVNEHGEYESSTFVEGAESYRIATYGRIWGISRQALINDDLSVFQTIPDKFGRAVQAFKAQFLVDLVESNPKMSDSKALFHADHRNVGTPAQLSLEALSEARLKLRKQTGLAGELVQVTPKFLLVPSELETQAEKVLSEIAAATVDDVNPFAKSLSLIVEPRLSDAAAWYVSASPAQVDGLEYAFLEGQDDYTIETEQGFEIDGTRMKVRTDFGAGFVDHRGWFKNAGL